ncbi:MAG: aromatic-ring-hydroxylating dioxygenase subunit beta [Pigmentiphaga sp.]
MTTTATLAELSDFVVEECERLDEGAYESWLELFADDGLYWVPLAYGQASPDSDHSLFCENPSLLRMRVARLRHPAAHGMAGPLRTSRVVGSFRLLEAGVEAARVSARFILVEYENERERLFAGKYTYDLRRVAAEWRIARKRVDLVNCDAPLASIQILL